MAEYIEREVLIAHIKNLPTWWADAGGVYGRSMKYPEGMFDCEDVISSVKNAPAADVAPVRHGRWDNSGRYTFPSGAVAVRCTNCGCALTESEYRMFNWNYCPVCGAKMDGGTDDGA